MPRLLAILLLFLSAAPQPAAAQVAVADSGDTAWMMLCGLLVLLAALPGLALRHAGLVHVRNALSIGVQGLVVAAGVSLLWALVGYSLAYAPGSGWLGGRAHLLLADLGALRDGLTVPESTFVLFQMALAILAAGLLPGAVAERVRLGWMALFALLWLLLVYAPVVHWVWGGGWLANLGVMDFAGALVVHLSAGFSALALVLVVGRRRSVSAGHAPVLGVSGGLLLWIGWAGIVGGWSFGATDNAATAILNGHFAACAGLFGWMLVERIDKGHVTANGLVSGALAGLVAISASGALVGPGGAMAIGLIAAVICRLAKGLLGDRIDDAADIFVIHGLGGLTGALLLLPFVLPALGGVGFAAGISLAGAFLAQCIGIAAVALWAMAGAAIIALMLSVVTPARIGAREEAEGLDIPRHGQQGWDFR
ncbi:MULTISPECIES: ammonium transporter [Sphingobium]|jgi:Amt family ammonium transporter|uniref:Ammonium transporter n=1 Tax=Sphingobium fuliginis (strain ATCC 27551) TaxID=336203 RepID=A0A292ZE94_SPHSA|nr:MULTISPECIES: ammonium transporter [Sphingobium]QOT72846.1 ammonium transporter [Sphingobium fuliginis]GAY21135.1 ammonium transporter [Sphingobium fuliginis]